MKVGMGKRRIYFKKAPVYSCSVQRCIQPTAVTVTVEQSSDRLQIGCSGKWQTCALIAKHVGPMVFLLSYLVIWLA